MRSLSLLILLLCSSTLVWAKKNKNKIVLIETTMGTMKVELFKETPLHSENFLKLVDEGFYDSLLFHRVIPNFMIQGGDPDSKRALPGQMLGNGDVGYKIPAEFMDTFYHKKGALAAARDNNPEKASSGCQFYIVQGKVFNDEDLNAMEARKGKPFPAKVREDYKTIGGTPHLDGGYTVFGQLLEGYDVLENITHVACSAGDRPIEDVRILSMKVVKK
ncbi:MAG TPA: peptidylprolyl isomerase [Chitinophagaceae bacterium]|nr:peptidylprolyl isomerase [Chitinophagaceae bacterium]